VRPNQQSTRHRTLGPFDAVILNGLSFGVESGEEGNGVEVILNGIMGDQGVGIISHLATVMLNVLQHYYLVGTTPA